MPCLCAPTTHAGSFRCRLHRSNSWGGRSVRPTHGQDLELSTASLIENSLQSEQQKQNAKKAVATAPLPPRSPSGRSPPKSSSCSRLRNVVSSSDEEDEVANPPTATPVSASERMSTMKMATGTGGSFSSVPGGRAAMFRMMKTGQSTSKIFS